MADRLPAPRSAPDDAADLMRLARFRAANPDWRIGYDRDLHYWEAWLREPGGGTIFTSYQLGDLLDKLEAPDSG